MEMFVRYSLQSSDIWCVPSMEKVDLKNWRAGSCTSGCEFPVDHFGLLGNGCLCCLWWDGVRQTQPTGQAPPSCDASLRGASKEQEATVEEALALSVESCRAGYHGWG